MWCVCYNCKWSQFSACENSADEMLIFFRLLCQIVLSHMLLARGLSLKVWKGMRPKLEDAVQCPQPFPNHEFFGLHLSPIEVFIKWLTGFYFCFIFFFISWWKYHKNKFREFRDLHHPPTPASPAAATPRGKLKEHITTNQYEFILNRPNNNKEVTREREKKCGTSAAPTTTSDGGCLHQNLLRLVNSESDQFDLIWAPSRRHQKKNKTRSRKRRGKK